MTPRVCAREHDVLMLVAISQWPRQAETELVMHVASCASCAETVAVAAAIRELESDEVTAPLPDARAVWQRAQWQARQDAMARAARPVVAMQGVAVLGTLTLMVVAAGWLSTRLLFGDRLVAIWTGVRTAAGAFGTAAITAADLLTFEIPGSVVWLLGGAIALGLTAVAVAIGLSTLADLQSESHRR